MDNNETELNESSESESDTDSETDSENENKSSYDDVKVVDLGVIEELKIDDLEQDNFADTTQFLTVTVILTL